MKYYVVKVEAAVKIGAKWGHERYVLCVVVIEEINFLPDPSVLCTAGAVEEAWSSSPRPPPPGTPRCVGRMAGTLHPW